jgi:rhodanese-related sulfurtransferase
VITYCDSGPAGAAAARTLTKLGFTKVFNLDGGLSGWTKDNMPLAKGSNSKPGSK